jgi:hypothetical protein
MPFVISNYRVVRRIVRACLVSARDDLWACQQKKKKKKHQSDISQNLVFYVCAGDPGGWILTIPGISRPIATLKANWIDLFNSYTDVRPSICPRVDYAKNKPRTKIIITPPDSLFLQLGWGIRLSL